MDYFTLMIIHLITITPCIILGAYLLIFPKGDSAHRSFGKIYLSLMAFTAFITLFMPARVGPSLFSHFGWIHLLSLLTLYTVPTALIAIKKGDIKSHKRKMIILYFAAILIAGTFTLMPGRFLHDLFFS